MINYVHETIFFKLIIYIKWYSNIVWLDKKKNEDHMIRENIHWYKYITL